MKENIFRNYYWKVLNKKVIIKVWNLESLTLVLLSIYYLKKKILETGRIDDRSRSGHPNTVVNDDSINIIKNELDKNVEQSQRALSYS